MTLFTRELRASPEVKDSSLYLVELFLNFFFNQLTFLEMVKGTHAVVTNKVSNTVQCASISAAFLVAFDQALVQLDLCMFNVVQCLSLSWKMSWKFQ